MNKKIILFIILMLLMRIATKSGSASSLEFQNCLSDSLSPNTFLNYSHNQFNIKTKYSVLILSRSNSYVPYDSPPSLSAKIFKTLINIPHVGAGILAREFGDDPRVSNVVVKGFDDTDAFDVARCHNIVMISIKTIDATAAYNFVKRLQALENPPKIILGGPHVSLQPKEAMKIAPIVIGEVEGLASKILDDIFSNKIKSVYEREYPLILRREYTIPDWDTYYRGIYSNQKNNFSWSIANIVVELCILVAKKYVGSIELSRGCPNRCGFCSVAKIQRHVSLRNIESIREEIERYPKKLLYIVDANAAISRNHFLAVIQLFNEKKIKYTPQVPLEIFIEDEEKYGGELLRAMSKNCAYVFTGIEDLTQESIKGAKTQKGINIVKKGIQVLHKYGIPVTGSFVFGLAHHTKDVFSKNLELAEQLGVDFIIQQIATPHPGTDYYNEIALKNMIFTKDYTFYDHRIPVMFFDKMSLKEYILGYINFFDKCYSISTIWKRLIDNRLPTWKECMSDGLKAFNPLMAGIKSILLNINAMRHNKTRLKNRFQNAIKKGLFMGLPSNLSKKQLGEIIEVIEMFEMDSLGNIFVIQDGNASEKDKNNRFILSKAA